MNGPLIELRHVEKKFGHGTSELKVLEDINLVVNRDEIVAVLGPSGSGKSTLLRIMAGLIEPSAGEVLCMGKLLKGPNPKVAMVFQTFAIFPWLTVLENVELGLLRSSLDEEERRQRALEMIDMIGLDGFESAYPKEISGGMRQRVGFARALAVNPEILLMDEAFSGLDVLTAENLRRDLLDLWEEHRIPTKAIVVVTHNIEEAAFLASRIVLLSRDPGRVIAEIPNTVSGMDRQDPRFLSMVDSIYSILTRKEMKPKIAAVERREIPMAPVGAMTGFIELLRDLGSKADLPEVAHDLLLEYDDLLPLVEAAEMLGFARVEGGDVELTEVGERFADAGVLERKEIFRAQALSAVPELKRMIRVLESKRNRRMPKDFFVEILEKHLTPAEALHRVETLIDWGRYAEILYYDEDTGQVFLEDATNSDGDVTRFNRNS
ncbi:MAG TPA: ATP-binding cassette domain-containing protein [Firmicutes bacterium]|nr:ATP-binding cassette domain-containing protein [Candidatus Fermentithermobacillaceae bacterium]